MNAADKNRDPERARKRAAADLRCSARKLGAEPAVAALLDVFSGDEIRQAVRMLGR